MKHIIAFAGSNSKQSINKQLATYAASLLEDVSVTVLDLNDFPLPIYNMDLEIENGIPEVAEKFLSEIQKADGIILSLAEHNGAYAAVFKNIFDWASRIDGKLWGNKSMLLMATSPGGRGGASVLDIAFNRFPFNGAKITDTFSLPFFAENFQDAKIITSEFDSELKDKVTTFKNSL